MKRYVPILVTAFVGAAPTPPEASSGRLDPHRNRMVQQNGIASSPLRRREDVHALAHDAFVHWTELAEQGPSARTRWEAKRRALLCQAWISGRRASLARLSRLRNPHRLSYRDICREFDAHRFGIA